MTEYRLKVISFVAIVEIVVLEEDNFAEIQRVLEFKFQEHFLNISVFQKRMLLKFLMI